MASAHEPYLKTALTKYKNPDVTKREITNVLNQYRDLRPKLEPFVFNNGEQRDLLNLEGTIPVTYRGNQYNIPICIWILDTHPQNPPMAYVKPTSSMQIRSGQYVDTNGKIDLPFLREWRHPHADLISLVQILTMTFGDECPVFSRVPPRGGPPPYSTNSGVGAAQPPYPPTGGGMPVPGAVGSSSGNSPYPPYTPTSTSGYPGSSYPNPPYPPSGYPGQNYGGFNQVGGSGYPPHSQSYGSSSGYPQQYQYSTPPGYPGYPNTSTNTDSSTNVRPGTGTVTEAHIKASLKSAVEDKLKRRLRETFAQAQAEMDVLKKTQTDLQSGKVKLEKMLTDLEEEKTDCEKNLFLLREKSSEVQEALRKIENEDELNMDEAVVTTTPLYRQLLNSFSEEQAIEDTIYYLGEALRKDVIDLEVFLKKIRELSRKQFMLRALIQKCREKAGLPPLA